MIQLDTAEKQFIRSDLKPYLQKNDLKSVIRICRKAETYNILAWMLDNGVPILKVMDTIPPYFFTEIPLNSVHIPSNVRKIDQLAFRSSQVKYITFDEGLEEIGTEAFEDSNCRQLKLPNSLTKLASRAFAYSHLSEVFIPDSITVLPIGLFDTCKDDLIVYANSRKNMPSDKKLECPQSEIEWYKKHLKLNLNGQSLENEETENNE